MTTTIKTPDLITLDEARVLGSRKVWRVRLVWDGPNRRNKSGRSFKYWQVTSDGSGHGVEIRWGALGRKGQSQTGVNLITALGKARAKLKSSSRSYVYDKVQGAQEDAVSAKKASAGITPAAPKRRAQLAQSLRSVELDMLLDLSACDGWLLIDEGADLSAHIENCPIVNVYVTRKGLIVGVERHENGRFSVYKIPNIGMVF